MSIPFVKSFEFEYGTLAQLSPLIQRVIANNPGPFTYTGTGVYIIGNDNVAVIDPGPDLAEHRAALDKALEGRKVSHVLMTHHHIDHSPLAIPLARDHGCEVYGFGLQIRPPEGGEVRLEGQLTRSTRLGTLPITCAMPFETKTHYFLAIILWAGQQVLSLLRMATWGII